MNDIYRVLEKELNTQYILGAREIFSRKRQTQNSNHSSIEIVEFKIKQYHTVHLYDVWVADIDKLKAEISSVSETKNFLKRTSSCISAVEQIIVSLDFSTHIVYKFCCDVLKTKEVTTDHTLKTYYNGLDYPGAEEYFLGIKKVASSFEEFQNYKLLV